MQQKLILIYDSVSAAESYRKLHYAPDMTEPQRLSDKELFFEYETALAEDKIAKSILHNVLDG